MARDGTLKGTVRGQSVQVGAGGKSYRFEKDQKVDPRTVNGQEVEFILVPPPGERQGQPRGNDLARVVKVIGAQGRVQGRARR